MDETDATAHWEDRYSQRPQVWSGAPNAALVAEVAQLPPGRALDLGSGEGGDTVWLAERGWQVTAVDIAPTAIGRAQALASSRGIPEDRIRWVTADLSTWDPDGPYDLVVACFLHSSISFSRTAVLHRARDRVSPGGHLLVVGHAEPPPWASPDHHHDHDFSADEELPGLELDPLHWTVVTNEVRAREAKGPDGEPARLLDSVVFVRRAE